MLKFLRSTGLLLLAGVSSCGTNPEQGKPPSPSQETVRKIDQGALIGFRADNGALVWLGVPYAAPPVGELRWRAPRPHSPWDGERQATVQPNWCVQVTNRLDKLSGVETGLIAGSEDCLYLNIFAPSGSPPEGGWPVMVWVHGGSNVWGRAEQYDGAALAESRNVVVVVLQYRLGPLGWFSHAALREDAETPLDQSSNFALLDIMQALKWTRANISAFGGDSQNLTLFGESAGAVNILALLSSSLATGLFDRAIVQSGMPASLTLDEAENGTRNIPNGSNGVVRRWLGDERHDAAALRAIPLAKLMAPYVGESGAVSLPTVFADGIVIPETGMVEALRAGTANPAVPLIIGSNRDEAKFLYAFDKRFTRRIFGVLPVLRDPPVYDAVTEYVSRAWRAISVDGLVDGMTSARSGAIYTYRFDWDEERSIVFFDIGRQIGAAHSLEVPFVFGDFSEFMGIVGRLSFGRDNAAGRERLSGRMTSYWSQFAYDGAPGRGRDDDAAFWAPAGEGGETLALDTVQGGGVQMRALHETIDGVFEDIGRDPRLPTENLKCMVEREILRIFSEISDEVSIRSEKHCVE